MASVTKTPADVETERNTIDVRCQIAPEPFVAVWPDAPAPVQKTGASVEYTFRCVGFMAAPEGANVFRRLGFYTSEEGRLQAEKELEEELANNK